MKWYVVVEGKRTEKKLYRSWLAAIFPNCRPVERPEDMDESRFFLLAGYGYPSYLERIRNAIRDIRATPDRFDRLVVCVDAEEWSADERRTSINEVIGAEGCPIAHTVVVQDCCVETWLLGNRMMFKENPEDGELRQYIEFYNVKDRDPEAMPAMDTFSNRAQFHCAYLKKMFVERNIVYTKLYPGHAQDLAYFHQIVLRATETTDLSSFRAFWDVCVDSGAQV